MPVSLRLLSERSQEQVPTPRPSSPPPDREGLAWEGPVVAELRLSLARRLARSARCPLLRPPVLPSQGILCCASDSMLRTGGGAPTPSNKDNGRLSGVTEPLFVGVEHPPEPSRLAFPYQACCGRESGSTCSLKEHGYAGWLGVWGGAGASGSYLYSDVSDFIAVSSCTFI